MGEQASNGNDIPARYRGDRAWTKERDAEAETIWEALRGDRNDRQAIRALRDLIVDCDNALRAHPSAKSGTLPTENSLFMQRLLLVFFNSMRDAV